MYNKTLEIKICLKISVYTIIYLNLINVYHKSTGNAEIYISKMH